MTHHVDLTTIRLESGSHATRKSGVCLMEAVAWWSEEEHTDQPKCVSPVIGAFGRTWNDSLNDEKRQRLVPLIPRMVGTAGDRAADNRRAWMAADWLVRAFAPAWLRLAGLTKHADALAQTEEVTTADIAKRALPIIHAAEAAARDAAEAAARAAAEDADWAGAWAAAGAGAWAAAEAAAGAGAWAAARAAARDAARDAARNAAGAAAWAAAGAAAEAAAEDTLAPTVAELQDSAYALLERMCDYRTPQP